MCQSFGAMHIGGELVYYQLAKRSGCWLVLAGPAKCIGDSYASGSVAFNSII